MPLIRAASDQYMNGYHIKWLCLHCQHYFLKNFPFKIQSVLCFLRMDLSGTANKKWFYGKAQEMAAR
jgi:hypothetical protein